MKNLSFHLTQNLKLLFTLFYNRQLLQQERKRNLPTHSTIETAYDKTTILSEKTLRHLNLKFLRVKIMQQSYRPIPEM